MKTYGFIFFLPLYGDESWASRRGHFTPCTHWIWGWVNLTGGLDNVDSRRILPLSGRVCIFNFVAMEPNHASVMYYWTDLAGVWLNALITLRWTASKDRLARRVHFSVCSAQYSRVRLPALLPRMYDFHQSCKGSVGTVNCERASWSEVDVQCHVVVRTRRLVWTHGVT
jgi:hypothetical protein